MENREAIRKIKFMRDAYQKLIDENVDEGRFVGTDVTGMWKADTPLNEVYREHVDALDLAISALEKQEQERWIPVTERLPSKEERREWIDKNLGGVGYLYPCLVTRYSSINPDRTKNNPYVAKHYFDGEDFLNAGEEVCSEYIIAWMPLPEPYQEGEQAGLLEGVWELKDHMWECNKCGCRINLKNPLDGNIWNYYFCPHCGTKMNFDM